MLPVWLTYAWNDNTDGDADFIAQQLAGVGLETRLDRWTLSAGQRLWEQIGRELSQNDLAAWIILATQNSCGSEACKEELAYALDRAFGKHGQGFPVIALFQSPVDRSILPPALGVRLCVSMKDSHWLERIKAAAERRAPAIPREELQPYAITVHTVIGDSFGKFAIEVRPRAGTWAPFYAAVSTSEKESVKMKLAYGPRGSLPQGIVLHQYGAVDGRDASGQSFSGYKAANEASPTMSYYIFCATLPSALMFGVLNSQSQFKVDIIA